MIPVFGSQTFKVITHRDFNYLKTGLQRIPPQTVETKFIINLDDAYPPYVFKRNEYPASTILKELDYEYFETLMYEFLTHPKFLQGGFVTVGESHDFRVYKTTEFDTFISDLHERLKTPEATTCPTCGSICKDFLIV